MIRTPLGALGLAAATLGLCPAADPTPAKPATPVELILTGGDTLARVELGAGVDGVPVAAVWDETFARLFAFFDRNGDGILDPKEAALLPAPKALRQAMGNRPRRWQSGGPWPGRVPTPQQEFADRSLRVVVEARGPGE